MTTPHKVPHMLERPPPTCPTPRNKFCSPVTGLSFESLDPQKPLLYSQAALSFVLHDDTHSSRSIPTQLVYPNGRISIGCRASAPVHWTDKDETESSVVCDDNGPNVRNDESQTPVSTAASQEEAPNVIVAYASETHLEAFDPRLRYLTLLLLLCIGTQTLCIAATFSGGTLLPFAKPFGQYWLTRPFLTFIFGREYRQRIYTGLLSLHTLPLIGILYRLPFIVSIYSLLQYVNFFLILMTCLYSVLDVVVLVSILPTRYLAESIQFYMMSHVMVLSTI